MKMSICSGFVLRGSMVFALFAMLVSWQSVFAQTSGDQIRLKDGSSVSGELQSFDGETFTIKLADGSTKTFTRAQVGSVVVAGEAVKTELPEGISVTAPLEVRDWYTFQRITTWKDRKDELAHNIHGLQLSQNGKKIIYGAREGTFTLNIDGSELKQLSAAYNNGKVCISADGSRVAWTDREGVFAANSDGSNIHKMPKSDPQIHNLAISLDGEMVYAMSHPSKAIYAMPFDGSDLKKLCSTADIAKVGDVKDSANLFGAFPAGFSLTADGSTLCFLYNYDVYLINTDGSNLRRVTHYGEKDRYYTSRAWISPDGQQLAVYNRFRDLMFVPVAGDKDNALTYSKVVIDQNPPCWKADGTKFACARGLRIFDTREKSEHNLLPTMIGNLHNPLARLRLASLNADFTQGALCFQYPTSANVDPDHITRWLWKPNPLPAGSPTLNDVTAAPPFLLMDGGNKTELTVKPTVTADHPPYVGCMFYDPNETGKQYTYYTSNHLKDDGKGGDKTAGDGVNYSTFALYPYGLNNTGVMPGPVALKIFAYDKGDSVLVVDVDGIKINEP